MQLLPQALPLLQTLQHAALKSVSGRKSCILSRRDGADETGVVCMPPADVDSPEAKAMTIARICIFT
tara:strand:+ start:889 stop:1089 length:201 start_codon:yes stop_codon:yes gene_type:complete